MSNGRVISLVMAADDCGAMPLTVAAYSAIKNTQSYPVNLFILDGGIRSKSKPKITQSLPWDRVTIHWIQPMSPRLQKVRSRGNDGGYPLPAYYRLLLPQILPDDVKKVIYLDIDVIVLHDLGELWDVDLGNYPFLAVQEPDGPYVIECFKRFNPHLKHLDFDKFGVTREHKYFNSGVMVINLERWRQDGVMEKALNFLDSYSPRFADQDVLNVILAGQWGTLDPRWNQTPAFYRKHENNPYSAQVVDQVVRDPFIVHFTGRAKPWGFESSHPRADLFSHYCHETAWAWTLRRNYWWHVAQHPARSLKRLLLRGVKL